MIFDRLIHTVDSHTDGNPTRVILSGFGRVPGATILEQRSFLQHERDDLRKLLLREPRGGALMCAVLVLPPCDPKADVGVVFLEPDEYPPMCGHCAIGTATTLVALGLVPRTEPETRVALDAPAGLVVARVQTHGARIGSTTITNVPSFLAEEGVKVALPNGGEVTIDISYGGEYYACVRAEDLNVVIAPERAHELVTAASGIRVALAGRKVPHPTRPDIERVYNVLIYQPDPKDQFVYRNVVVCPPGAIDRSPCGTGTSALMALLEAKGLLVLGQTLRNHGILGTAFDGRLIEEVPLGSTRAFVPEVTGRAYLTGIHDFVLDPDDPFPTGYLLG